MNYIPGACEPWRTNDFWNFIEIRLCICIDIAVAIGDGNFKLEEDKEIQNDKIRASSRF